MPMYNLIEYSGNYSDTSGSLRQFKRYESPINAGILKMLLQIIHLLLSTNQVF